MATSPPTETLVRDRGQGGTVVLRTQGGRSVYVKTYATPAEAERCVEVLTALREEGFHDRAVHRVPAVLDHRPEDKLVVLAPAQGTALATLVHDRSPPAAPARDWLAGVRGAARWLADLHETPTTVVRTTDRARGPLDRLRRRRDVLAATRPELAEETADLLHTLLGRTPPSAHAVHRTTHGRYHPEHVFLDPGAGVVTGIDLDRATPGDPGRDLGEFVHRARAMLARADRADVEILDRSTASFIEEYRAHRSTEAELTSLAYHWSFAALWHLLGSMAKGRSPSSLARLRAEFAAVPRLVEQLT